MRNKPIPEISPADQAALRAMVCYEDEAVMAFNKPSGLAVQTRGNHGTSLDHLLWTFARSNGKRPDLVHRIDTGTSGLLIVAKTKPATRFFNAAFAERRVEKRYLALVSGRLPETDSGVCDLPLVKIDRRVFVSTSTMRAVHGAQSVMTARTLWRVWARQGDTALIEARPETGRMHQIRAHLSAMGCAILGDPIYGRASSAPRVMLHAAGLRLPHPNGRTLTLEAPVPADFDKLGRTLGLI